MDTDVLDHITCKACGAYFISR